MCGIAGSITFNKERVALSTLLAMTDVIEHRGPDGQGHWINAKANAGLAHRRLSILDLSELGKQPMHYADGRYTITFNGEIYNYIELKEELLKKGYTFISNSDTEVLLALFDLKKEKCLDDLDGMFAFAIWDEKEQVLFCARDRFGEKPFHYFSDAGRFLFGSEIKQLWSAGVHKKMSPTRLQAYLLNGQIDDASDLTSTFYEQIKRLDAAHYMYVYADGRSKIDKYWEINLNATPFTGTLEQAAEQFRVLLTESVRLRLRSDVPVGSSLSGGLDSSSIVMLIDQLKGNEQKQNTFSARFKDYEKDEGKHIEEVVKKCKNLDVHYTWPDQDYFLNVLDKVIYHQDEPFVSASIVAQYAVMEIAKKNNVTVLLDGQGADEYLAGYLPYYKLYLDQLFYNNKKQYGAELSAYNSFHSAALQYNDLQQSETLTMKLGRYKRKLLSQPMPYSADALSQQLRKDVSLIGLKELLRYADRNSMAHSREVRLPFLSHKLVEFAFSLPNAYLLNLGWTKFVLRKAMSPMLPESICWRVDKVGYEPPQKKWMDSPHMMDEVATSLNLFGDILKNKNTLPVGDPLAWRALVAKRYFN